MIKTHQQSINKQLNQLRLVTITLQLMTLLATYFNQPIQAFSCATFSFVSLIILFTLKKRLRPTCVIERLRIQ